MIICASLISCGSETSSESAASLQENSKGTVDNDGIDPGDGGTDDSDEDTENNDGGAGTPTIKEWIQEAYLKANDAQDWDYFGSSVAISGDAIVIGAYLAETGSESDSGAAYVFRKGDSGWTQEAYLTASNPETADYFGYATAMDGDTIAIGAYQENSSSTTIVSDAGLFPSPTTDSDNATDAGAVYVFSRSNNVWSQEAYIKASNAESNDLFGHALALDGNTLVVGAHREDNADTTILGKTSSPTPTSDNDNGLGNDSGAVYVFVRTSNGWVQEAYLKPTNAEEYDFFGDAVAIDGDTLVVGSNAEDSSTTTIIQSFTELIPGLDDDSAGEAGAAYVFKRTNGVWKQEAYLKATNSESDDYFGSSVDIEGDTVVVGAPAEDGQQTKILQLPNALPTPGENEGAGNAGAVYVYTRTNGLWTAQAYLKAPNAELYDAFGSSVSLDGNLLAVGAEGESSGAIKISNAFEGFPAPGSDNDSKPYAGAAYVFSRQSGKWSPQAYIKASNSDGTDYFGRKLQIDGSNLVVGAHFEDSNLTGVSNGTDPIANQNDGYNTGAAYVYSLEAKN